MSRRNEKRYTEYCTGCGLCKSIRNVEFYKDEKGYEYPKLTEKEIEFCKEVCPAGGKALLETSGSQVWGNAEEVYLGWSEDDDVREKASSGGMLTTLCLYLLEKEIVDGIIQTKVDDHSAYGTKTVISRTREDILECKGSRYAISSPLKEIRQLLEEGEKYAFVGKPCDVSALAMYLKKDAEMKEQIPYLFSFFCAGVPSESANIKLLKELNCADPKDCVSLQYRGNGWPGYAMAVKKDGTQTQMTYEDSWGKILGRDVRKSCRFCIDGIGEMADISCGDAWYLTEDKKPSFAEASGRNVVFARSEKGTRLLERAFEEGYVHLEDYRGQLDDLKFIQKYQYERKATMGAMLTALRIFRKAAPDYDKKKMREYGKGVSRKRRVKRFLGSCKRIMAGKM